MYTMEGFEAINFATKRSLQNHCNHRGNVCQQTMVKIVHKYKNHHHNVCEALEKREKMKPKIIKQIRRIHHDNGRNITASTNSLGPVVAL